MSISSNIKQLQASIPEGVTLVAVSKFHPVEALQEAYAAGQRVFGENKAQELLLKQELEKNAKIIIPNTKTYFVTDANASKISIIEALSRFSKTQKHRMFLSFTMLGTALLARTKSFTWFPNMFLI